MNDVTLGNSDRVNDNSAWLVRLDFPKLHHGGPAVQTRRNISNQHLGFRRNREIFV